ncbi:GTPase Era [Pelagibius litoralis]|uniref:GTPase Era n=1 Tax=Pelagibius litoralis TaxID=374515 RepID=A0A967C2E6_9PROT|nr:GTPase Era [Pelagibius litoralis]NIA67000.1 GTPase Era [Pelagibius litoralis]
MSEVPAGKQRCGFVAVVGAPNAGKSTLVNRLVGAKVSIVTHKVQTTRTRVRGIAISGDSQIIFVDTPGIFGAKRRFERAMVQAAWAGVEDADAVLVVHDAGRKNISDEARMVIDGLAGKPCELILVLNKIDLVKRERLLELTAQLSQAGNFAKVFMISALNGDGVADLIDFLALRMPLGPWHFPEDQLSDITLRLMASELTREKLFLNLHQELPYALTVESESWEEFKDGSVRIEQTVYVTRDQHKAMCLGKGGRTIRAVREAAQAELKEALGQPVHLFIFVKVRENWANDPERYRMLGLEFDA